ncbi:MAG: hypothetical protein QOG51_243 [Verrucomicrobiota bacterium]|jgi:hypothetical protein
MTTQKSTDSRCRLRKNDRQRREDSRKLRDPPRVEQKRHGPDFGDKFTVCSLRPLVAPILRGFRGNQACRPSASSAEPLLPSVCRFLYPACSGTDGGRRRCARQAGPPRPAFPPARPQSREALRERDSVHPEADLPAHCSTEHIPRKRSILFTPCALSDWITLGVESDAPPCLI